MQKLICIGFSLRITFGKRGKLLTRKAIRSPFVKRLCTEREVKIDASAIPIKTAPLKSAAASLNSNTCKLPNKSLAMSVPSIFRLYK